MKPVFINGQAYLPARSEAAALGYELNYNAKEKEIEISKKEQEEAVNYLRTMGIIVSVKPAADGQYQFELLGKGENKRIILSADKDTVIKDGSGKAFAAKDLKAGTQIEAEYGPIIAMSYPGQSHAVTITVGAERLIKEDVIQSVRHTEDGWQVLFGETKDGVAVPTLALTAGKETSLITEEGQPLEWAYLKAGTKVRAYYGPVATKTLPLMSPLYYLVVVNAEGTEQLAPAAASEFRELSWSQLGEQKSHVTTKKDEAKVEVIDANGSGLFARTEEQKKLLESIQAANGKLVTVTYNTDQDEILGPLTVVFDLETKALVGFNIRK